MADAVVVATVTRKFKVGRVIRIYGTLAYSATTDNYKTGGNVLDFSAKAPGCRKPPVWVAIHGQAGYMYEYDTGTTIANGTVLIRKATTTNANDPLGQHSAAALDAAVIADDIRFVAEFDALN